MPSMEYVIGLIVGILVGLAVVALVVVVCRKKNGMRFGKCEYDERQLLARGKAFQAGFFTILIYEAVYAVADWIAADLYGVRWCVNVTGVTLGLMLGITVFAVVAITRDAYLSLNEKPGGWIAMWCAVIALNLASGIGEALEGELIRDGMLTEKWMNWMCAGMFAVILVAQLAHNRKLKREELEEE